MATLFASKDYIIDLVIVEATTILKAAIFCRELGHQRVELEGDALQVVEALRRG